MKDKLNRHILFQNFRKSLEDQFGAGKAEQIWQNANEKYAEMEHWKAELDSDSRMMILPSAALYQALREYAPEMALPLLREYGTQMGEKIARVVRGVTSVPGVPKLLWKHMPSLMRTMSSEKKGYTRRIVSETEELVGVDILSCPLHEAAKKIGVPEAALVVCAMDKAYMTGFKDINYTRTTSVAEGDACCDYRLSYDGPKEPFTETTFECRRGDLTIRGTQYRPAGENLPVAIVSHGFMAWQDTVRQYARELARLGYCAYCFDFCGGSVLKKGKSDGETTQMSVLTEVQDLEAVITYVQSLPYTGNELLLMGCSQGGFVSALTAAKHPGLADKLVLFYPALCIPDDARSGKMMLAKFDPQNIPERLNCGPMKLGKCYVADVIGMDPYAEICSYRGPVLIVHGTEDRIVNLNYSKRAQKAYPNAKLHIIGGGGHGFGKKHDAIAIAHLKRFAAHHS